MEEREKEHVDDGGEENVVVERGRKQGRELLQSIDEGQEEFLLHVRLGKSVDGVDVIHSHRQEKRDDEVRR